MRFLACFIFLLTPLTASGENNLKDDINPFYKDYVSLEFVKNYPISKAQDQFAPNKKTWLLGYTHFLSREWSVGISAGFKSLLREELGKELALLSFSNHSHYVIRLYHPTYLMIGTKLTYMTPNEQSKLPLIKDPDFETEVGVGVSAQLAHKWGPTLITFRIDRWRGTKTNRLHGFEVAVGLSHRLKE